MKLIIYGAGRNCCGVLRRIDSKDSILCIADADTDKEGTKIKGINVVSPLKIQEYEYDIIVVSVDHKFEEIKKQLTTLGIREDKIIHWTNFIIMSPHNTGSIRVDWHKGIKENEIYTEMCSHESELSEMERFFLMGRHNSTYKWSHFFEIYNRHFEKYIGKDVTIMEIGVNKGGSLQMWKQIFGPGSKIIGVDINQTCKQMEDEQISIYIGDQEDRMFWKRVKDEIPPIDILIDDGGHQMNQQIVTFEEMFSHIKENGIYLCEDTVTSYDPQNYNSGCKNPGTFIEYSKNFIDYIHAWYAKEQNLHVNEYTKNLYALHYYYGVLVVEKRKMYSPFPMNVCNTDEKKYVEYSFYGEF